MNTNAVPSTAGFLGSRRALLVSLALVCAGWPGHLAAQTPGPVPPDRGNVLIADQFNNRVIEVNRAHQIVWSFGDGSSTAGPRSIVAPNDAQRVGSMTLMSGTGAPAGAEPTCPDGCGDNRVILVDRQGKIVWQYGQAGVAGADFNQLNAPVCSVFLPTHHVLITDQGNQRVIEVNVHHQILWQYGITGVSGLDPNQLNDPNSAEMLENGHILIADEGNNRVIEVTRDHQIVWSYGNPLDLSILNGPAFASRLPDGNTLIADGGNNRIIEVNPRGAVTFEYHTNTRPGSVAAPIPTRAVRQGNGNTLISDQFNHQVIEINPAKEIVFSQGTVGVAGAGSTGLNAPYDAKVIGDYTGLTPPFLGEDVPRGVGK